MTACRIGNASGFYGDRFAAMREMLTGGPLDVLTGDYLAELTMLILGRDRARDESLGYARTFLRQLEECLGLAVDRGVRLVVNAGGLNPAGLASAVRSLASRLGVAVAVGHVEGDDVRSSVPGALTANAYLGCWGIVECLRGGADVVVTGRVTDASLLVGPAAWWHGWAPDAWDALAGATVAGHVLECGAQATGGNYAFFTEIADLTHPGFPLAEVHADGSAVVTKHPGTGGAVTVGTVTAQLLYEIGAPDYLGPDVVTRFDTIRLAAEGADRVRIAGVRGSPPPATVKVGVNTLGGYRNAMTFVLTGTDIDAKAQLVRTQLAAALDVDLVWTLARTDREDAGTEQEASALLHVVARDADAARVGRAFSSAAVELALASYPGFFPTSPPGDASPYGVFTATTLPQEKVEHIAVRPDGTRIGIAPPPAFRPDSRSPAAGPAAGPSGPPPAGPAERADAPAEPSAGPGAEPARQPGSSTEADASTLDAVQAAGSAGPAGPTRRVPLGAVVGARSGDKGGAANLGIWVREPAAYPWLEATLTVERLKELLPEAAELPVERHPLPNLGALNFVIDGLLGQGVAASTRFDPQAKGLGEWLRSRHVDVPEALL